MLQRLTDNNKYISRVYCVVAGSCRPFQRSSQMQHEYELKTGELSVAVVFHGVMYSILY